MAAGSRSNACGPRFIPSHRNDHKPRADVTEAAGRGGGHPLPAGPLARPFPRSGRCVTVSGAQARPVSFTLARQSVKRPAPTTIAAPNATGSSSVSPKAKMPSAVAKTSCR